jgi:ribosome assembly protein 1
MIGQGLKPVESVKAGNLVAIRGLGKNILKSATISSTRNCWPFSSMTFQVAPMLKVAIEPSDPADIVQLMEGLRLLNRADPFVEVTVSGRGEHVLAAAGEVHLERCIKDLKERFAKVNIEVSPPLVSYKETIESDPLEDLKCIIDGSDFIEKKTANDRCTVKVRIMKLPESLTKILEESADLLGDLMGGKAIESHTENTSAIEALKKRITDCINSENPFSNNPEMEKKYKSVWEKILKRIWALGPRQVGPNILLTPDSDPIDTDDKDSVIVKGSPYVSEKLGFKEVSCSSIDSHDRSDLYQEAGTLESSVLSGFQLATAAGPLCEEPMWGLALSVETHVSRSIGSETESEQYGMFSGQVMTAVKDACKEAVRKKNPRIVEGMYFCELNTPSEYLGPMYAVLSRRRARVLEEEMQEGSPMFTVHAYVPVAESFGFTDELRRWTSGASSALLVFSHWEAVPEDPFFIPKTDEEKEEFGDGLHVLHNSARKLIDSVRRRKGLKVEEKVVQHATKQRTLSRKV